jgi:hypothetical protein
MAWQTGLKGITSPKQQALNDPDFFKMNDKKIKQ